MNFKRALLIAVATLASAQVLPAHAAGGAYSLEASHALPGEGGWDYLAYDAPSRRLFVTRGTRVQVVDPDTGRVLGEIPDTPGVHGVALAGDLGKGYTSNGGESTVSVFDLKTLQVKAKIKLVGAEGPDAIAYDAGTRRVFTFNGRSHNASVIDAVTDRLAATVPLHGKPEFAVVDGRGKVYVNLEDTNELSAIDTASAKLLATWALKGCDGPSGLAIDTAARRLFVGCHNQVMLIVNADTGGVVASLPIGKGVDANAFDASTRQAFSSQWDGTLTVVGAEGGDRFAVEQTATTQRGARTMALNPQTHAVYLVTADFKDAPKVAGQAPGRPVLTPGTVRLLVMAPKAP